MARADFAGEASPAEAKDKAWPTVEEVETVLKAIQLFDPVGVAARTPQECLLIQIKALGYDRDQVLVDLVRDHLEDLEAHRYKPLLRKFRLDMDELKEYLDIIQSLDPCPERVLAKACPPLSALTSLFTRWTGNSSLFLMRTACRICT